MLRRYPMNSDHYRYAICKTTGDIKPEDIEYSFDVSNSLLTNECDFSNYDEDFIVMGLTLDQIIAYLENHVLGTTVSMKDSMLHLTAYYVYQDIWENGQYAGWNNIWSADEFSGAVGRTAREVVACGR